MEVGGSGIRRKDAISSEVSVSDIVKDTAAAIETSSDSIRRVASGTAPYTNNDPVVSDRVGNRGIAVSTAILNITATTASTMRGSGHSPARGTTIT